MKLTDQIIEHAMKKKKEEKSVVFDKTVSTGSTLLDLCISGGRIKGGGLPGGIIVEVYGSSGSGKCVTGDALIFVDNKLTCISELATKIDGFVEMECNVQSINGQTKSSHFFEETADHLIRVENDLGMSITGTPEHPILCMNEGNLKPSFKKLEDITNEDYICVNYNMNCFNETNIPIEFNQIKKTNSKLIDPPNELTPSLSRLLGYIIANGCNGSSTREVIRMSTNNRKIQNDIKSICKELSINVDITDKNSLNFSIGGRWFHRFLTSICGEVLPKSRFKVIPDIVLKSSRECQINFIRALFDCDSYSDEKGALEYSTASKELARQVQMVLLNFGIVSSLKPKYLHKYDHTYWRLSFYGQELDTYIETFGSLKYEIKRTKRNTNKKSIPFIRKHIDQKVLELKNRYNVKANGQGSFTNEKGKTIKFRFKIGHALNTNTKANLTQNWLNKFKEQLYAMPKFPGFVELLSFCESIDLESIYYSRISKIEKINEPQRVYDFTIPDGHNFFSNGFISHNTAILSEIAASAQVRKGEVMYLDPEARLDREYAQIYGVSIPDDQYFRPNTVREMFDKIWNWEIKNDKVINVMAADSLAALSTEIEMEGQDKMGMKRAKDFSEGLRKTARLIAEGSRLLVCSNQIRQGDYGNVTPGGKAVEYYCSVRIEIAKSTKGWKIEKSKTIDGKKHDRQIGIRSKCTIKKNSIDTPFRECNLSIVFGHGIDDIRDMLQWHKDVTGGTKYNAISAEFATMDAAISAIEKEGLYDQLKERTIDMWTEIENNFKSTRPAKIRK